MHIKLVILFQLNFILMNIQVEHWTYDVVDGEEGSAQR